MKKIITATNIDLLHKLIKQQDNADVLLDDITSQEKLWEAWQDDYTHQADVLIVSDELPGVFSAEEMFSDIKDNFKGEVFALLKERDERLIRYLRSIKIVNIFTIQDDPEDLLNAIFYGDFIDEKDGKAHEESLETTSQVEKVYINKKIISVIGTGGIGKTSVCLNLAKVLKKHKYNVCVLDFNLEKPDVALVVGVEERGLQQVIKLPFDADEIKNAITHHKSISYFTGLKNMMDITDVDVYVKGIIKVLHSLYDVLIIDTGNISSVATHHAICEADHQVLVTNTAERNIIAVKKYIDLYKNNLKTPLNLIGLANQVLDSTISKSDLEEIMEIKFAGYIKHDKRIYTSLEKNGGFNKGNEAIEMLAAIITDIQPQEALLKKTMKRLIKR